MAQKKNEKQYKSKEGKLYLEHGMGRLYRRAPKHRITSGKPTGEPPKDKNGDSNES